MDLTKLVNDLKAAVQERRWFDVMRLSADAIKAGADVGEQVFKGLGLTGAAVPSAEPDLAGLTACVAECKRELESTTAAAPAGIDPNTVITLVTLVIQLIQQWRANRQQ